MISKKQTSHKIEALPVVESMEQASAITGMPLSVVRASKRAGCPAFGVAGRIRLQVLLQWYFSEFAKDDGEEIPEGLATWREALNRIQTKREELKLSRERGEMMPTADAQTQAAQAMAETFSQLERRDRELPPALAGLGAIEIHKRMSRDTETIRKILKEKFETIGA